MHSAASSTHVVLHSETLLNWFTGCNYSVSSCRSVYGMSLEKIARYYWVSEKAKDALRTVTLIDKVTQILLLAINSMGVMALSWIFCFLPSAVGISGCKILKSETASPKMSTML